MEYSKNASKKLISQLGRYFWLWAVLFVVIFNATAFLLSQRTTAALWDAVPNDASIAYEFQIQDSILPEEFPDCYLKKQFLRDVKLLQSFVAEKDQPILAVLQGNTPDFFNCLFILAYKNKIERLDSFSEDYFRKSILQGVEVFESDEFALAHYKGLLLLAAHRFQVERAIKQLKQPSRSWLKSNPFLLKQNNESAFYVRPANLSLMLSSFLSPQGNKWLADWSKLEDWIVFTFDKANDGWRCSGQSSNPTSYKDHTPIINILPKNVAYFNSVNPTEVRLPFDFEQSKNDKAITGYFNLYNNNIEQYYFKAYFSQQDLLAPIRLQLQQGTLELISYQMFELYKNEKGQYFTLLDDCLIVCNELQQLQIWLDQYIVGALLQAVPAFFEQKTNCLFYLDSHQLNPMLKWLIKLNYQADATQEWKKISPFSVQLSHSDGQWQGFIPKKEILMGSGTNIIWRVDLLEEAITSPTVLKTKGNEMFIFIQDASKRLYCFDEMGNERWQKDLEAIVLSPIQIVEGKTPQFLFNTKYNVYLLDEAGSNQAAYPMELQSPAKVGLTLIDFNQMGDYHYLFACENGKVYGFDLKGYPMDGWNPKDSIGTLQQPVLHFQHDNQDFIALLSDSTLYVFGRYGNLKFDPYTHTNLKRATLDYQLSSRSNRIVVADSKGYAHVVALNGSNFRLKINAESGTSIKFAFADVCKDSRKDYITLHEKRLAIYAYDTDNKFELRQEYQFTFPQDTVFAFPSYIGTITSSAGKIYLLKDGRPVKGFPLPGTHPFVLTNFSSTNNAILVTANEDSVYAYQISPNSNQ